MNSPGCRGVGVAIVDSDGPDGKPVSIVGLDSCIIQNPKVWEASGHVGGFNDPMVDCKESKKRYRADQLFFAPVKVDGGTIGYVLVEESGSKISAVEGGEFQCESYVDEATKERCISLLLSDSLPE